MIEEPNAALALRHDLVKSLRELAGLPDYLAGPIADRVACDLCRRMQGLDVTAADVRYARARAVKQDFNGNNHEAVRKKHHISERTLYRILGGSG